MKDTAGERPTPDSVGTRPGPPPAPPATNPNSTKMVRVRVDQLDRAKRLIEPLRDDPSAGANLRLSAAYVIRLAIARGLDSLEKELGV